MVSAAAQSHLVQESSSTAPSQEAAPQEDAAQEVEVEEGEGDEEEGECGFCLFMKGGGCKEAFVAWEECVEAAEKEGSDVVERCFQATANLKKCMDAHADYYAPVLQAEQAVSDHAEAAIAANADKKNDEKSAPSPATDGDSKAETVTEKAFSSPAAEEAVVEKTRRLKKRERLCIPWLEIHRGSTHHSPDQHYHSWCTPSVTKTTSSVAKMFKSFSP